MGEQMDAWMHGWVNEDSCKPSAVDFSRQVQYVADAFAHVYTVPPMLATLSSWPHRHLASRYLSMTPKSQSTDTAD